MTDLGGHTLTNSVFYKTSASLELLTDKDIYLYLDSRMRSYQVVHLDGTTNQYVYACCGLDFEIDRDGAVTQYYYDALKRQTASSRNGVTTTNVLDVNGAILKTIRIGGTNAITQVSCQYDLVGRISFETNALGGVTIYTNYFDGNGQQVQIVTNPDGGTRIETRAQDGSNLTIGGTADAPLSYSYGADSEGPYTIGYRLDGNGGSNEWIKTSRDLVGRGYKISFASASSPPFSISYFNIKGQLTNQVDPDGVSQLFTYNAKGEQDFSVLDSNRNLTIDFSGADRITFVTNDVIQLSGVWNNAVVRRTRTYQWADEGSLLVGESWTATNGIRTAYITFGLTNQTVTTYAAGGYRFQTNIALDGSFSVSTFQYGQLLSTVQRDSVGTQLSSISFGYDAHGRQNVVTDVRTGTTTYTFTDSDQAATVATPDPGTGSQVTTMYYDNMGRNWKTTLPDNTSVTNKFAATGAITNTFGSRMYPVAYTFDAQGRMKSMKTWKDFANNIGDAVTTWNYDIYRGWLTNKTYAGDVAGPSYAYTSAGRLQTRTSARGIATTYSYNGSADLSGVDYSDSTADIAYGYDRRGRRRSISSAGATCSFAFSDAGMVISESYSGGPLSGFSVTNGYDSSLRRTALGLASQPAILTQYGYDSASRISSVTNGSLAVVYGYLTNSPMVANVTFKQNGATRLMTTNSYDTLNRLTSVASMPSASDVTSFKYQYNTANQRTSITNANSSLWVYTYDSLGQVTSGKKYWNDGTPVAGQQFQYTSDDVGNRKTTAIGGNASGNDLRSGSYSVNSLNQYTNRQVPSFVDILGESTNTAKVLVNNQIAYRHGDYFRAELPVDNDSAAVWLSTTNIAILENGTNAEVAKIVSGHKFLPKTLESFGYDADGNMTNDGRWFMTWDAENRLISMISLTNNPSESKMRLFFGYDCYGRRITKSVETWTNSSWSMIASNKFVYDRWNVMAELNATNDAIRRFFTWGPDMSTSLQNAGGVGGLLAVSDIANGTNFVAYDGNGNVVELIGVFDGIGYAKYEYGPFGELLRVSGIGALSNPFRLSTKYTDDETEFVYYGYRYLNVSIGRWLNRDLLDEGGDLNLYRLVVTSIDGFDLLGLAKYVETPIPVPDVDLSKIKRNNGLLRPATDWERWKYTHIVWYGGNKSQTADSLVNRYMDGTGKGYLLSRSEADGLEALIQIKHIAGFQELAKNLKEGEKVVLKPTWVPAAAGQKGTLGRFYARLGGEICKGPNGWTFKGEIFFDDLYDYITPGGVPRPTDLPPIDAPMPYERTTVGGIASGQGKVQWAEKSIPGAPFWVRSHVMPAMAKQGDSSIKYGSNVVAPIVLTPQGGEFN